MPDKRRGRSPRKEPLLKWPEPDVLPVELTGLGRISPPALRRADRLRGSHLQLHRFRPNARYGLWGKTAGLKVLITPSTGDVMGWGALGWGNIVVCDFHERRWLGPAIYVLHMADCHHSIVTRLDEPPKPGERIGALVIAIYRHDLDYKLKAMDLRDPPQQPTAAGETNHVH